MIANTLRELLDNEQRAANAGNWFLKPYLEKLIELLIRSNPHDPRSRASALAVVYQLLGAANYFALSQPTLQNMFGDEMFGQTKGGFEASLREMLRNTING